MTKKKKSPARNIGTTCCIILLMSLFLFGGLIPVIIGGLIALPCIYLASRSSSKDNEGQNQLFDPTQVQSNIANESPTKQLLIQPKFCTECGSPLEGNQCEFCGKIVD